MICSLCSNDRPTSWFRADSGRTKTRTDCRQCRSDRHRAWRANNREHIRTYDRGRWQQTDRWAQCIRSRYGLTVDAYEAILTAQDGKCAVCSTDQPGGRSARFHVDHDHATGKVRGLLCFRCNTVLGAMRDEPSLLTSAIAYLNRSVPRKPRRSSKPISPSEPTGAP